MVSFSREQRERWRQDREAAIVRGEVSADEERRLLAERVAQRDVLLLELKNIRDDIARLKRRIRRGEVSDG